MVEDERILIDGRQPPKEGDDVKMRILRKHSGKLVIDRPFRNKPVQIVPRGDNLAIPENSGTYRVTGCISMVALSDTDDADYFYLKEPDVTHLDDRIIAFPEAAGNPGIENGAEKVDVDVDVSGIFENTEFTEEQDSQQEDAFFREDPIEDMNELLIGIR